MPASNIKVFLIIFAENLKDEMSGVYKKFGLEEKVPIYDFDLIVFVVVVVSVLYKWKVI